MYQLHPNENFLYYFNKDSKGSVYDTLINTLAKPIHYFPSVKEKTTLDEFLAYIDNEIKLDEIYSDKIPLYYRNAINENEETYVVLLIDFYYPDEENDEYNILYRYGLVCDILDKKYHVDRKFYIINQV